MDIEPDAWAEITLIDGEYENYDPVLAKFPIINGSFPQGYTGTQPKMKVLFNYRLPSRCPTLYDCVKFTMMIDSGSSKWTENVMMETLPTLPALCEGNPPVTGGSPHKGPVMRSCAISEQALE